MLIKEKVLISAFEECLEILIKCYPEQEARQITSWVFEEVTGMQRHLFRLQNRSFTEDELHQLNKIIQRLQLFEPIQQVLGHAYFRRLKLQVNKYTLIPRPETEELVGYVLRQAKLITAPVRIIDIGTGSGCIAISIKDEMPEAMVYALDISAEALQVARANALNCATMVNFVLGDFLEANTLAKLPQVDIIVSNPPYITKSEETMLDKHVRDYEPAQALFVPDDDPLLYYKQLTTYALLMPRVWLFSEVHENYAQQTAALFTNKGGKQTQIFIDMQGKARMVASFFEKS
ncbi:MAG: peptide chain release factor N(5)-glutamine methyltransferase [Bacteroidota bacterium]